MTIEFVLPFGRPSSVKNLVFSILSYEHPLKLVELTNLIRKRYGRQPPSKQSEKQPSSSLKKGYWRRPETGSRST